VVYGMPQEAVRAGVVDVQLPVADLAARLSRAVRRRG
jgi:chemotaxis response regulator CheB